MQANTRPETTRPAAGRAARENFTCGYGAGSPLMKIIDKRRPAANIAEVVNVVGEVEGRDCLLADDMIDTAGTVTASAHALKKLGARDIYICATHALLSGPAVERLRNAPVKEVTVTDTICIPEERRFPTLNVLSVGELLAKAIRSTHAYQSVSSLFE